MYGEKIKAKRRELNLSQEDLADKLFVTRQAISKWENDKATPTMTNLRELSEVFGVDMAYFIGESKVDEEEKEKEKDEAIEEKKAREKFLERAYGTSSSMPAFVVWEYSFSQSTTSSS